MLVVGCAHSFTQDLCCVQQQKNKTTPWEQLKRLVSMLVFGRAQSFTFGHNIKSKLIQEQACMRALGYALIWLMGRPPRQEQVNIKSKSGSCSKDKSKSITQWQEQGNT
jgi:hypothetical protein